MLSGRLYRDFGFNFECNEELQQGLELKSKMIRIIIKKVYFSSCVKNSMQRNKVKSRDIRQKMIVLVQLRDVCGLVRDIVLEMMSSNQIWDIF